MNRNNPAFLSLMMAVILSAACLFLFAGDLLAVPPPPSGFWGTVTEDGANVPNDTEVTAWINGTVYQTATTEIVEGLSYYSIDVPGDDDATGTIEGGQTGQTVEFKVNGQTVQQTGTWQQGSNVRLDLTVPEANPQPQLVSVSPDAADPGDSLAITLIGSDTNFATGVTSASFGSGIVVIDLIVNTPTEAVAEISIASDAAPGARTVTVTTGNEEVAKSNAFTIRSPNIDIYLPTIVGPVGAQVTLPVTIPTSVTGLDILSYQFSVTFDSAVLEGLGIAKASSMSDDWNVTENHATPGRISVAAYHTSPLAGSGVLLYLRFQVVGASGAETDLALADFDFNSGEPGVVAHNGSLEVQGYQVGGTITYASTASPVTDVTMTLAGPSTTSTETGGDGTFSLSSGAAGTYSLTPDKTGDHRGAIGAMDASYVAQCVVGSLDMASVCPLASSDVSEDGRVMAFDAALIARYVVALYDPPSRTGEWVFAPASRTYSPLDSDQADQDFQAYLAGDVTGNWAGIESQSFSTVQVGLSSPVATSDEDGWSVSVRITSSEQLEIYAYSLEVVYDPPQLRFDRLVITNTLSGGWQIEHNSSEPGLVRIAAYTTEPITNGGDLLTLQFTGRPDDLADSTAQLTAVRFNEGDPAVEVMPTNPNQRMLFLPTLSR